MQIEEHGGYSTVILPDIVDLRNAYVFKEALQLLYDKDYSIIEVDCHGLTMISTAGIGSLLVFQRILKERGGELKIVHVRDKYIEHLFDTIDLRRVIHIE